MGVPAFFRWLSTKYPSIVTNCVEKHGPIIDNNGTRGPVDTTAPNPNGIEFDNLYLDMNGIIHPCTHPENKPAPKNEPEMFVAIFEYIDRLFAIIRPRRVLYMAIDGVAPRAKMNQQRSRRFRAAQESREKRMTVERLRQELLTRGAYLPPPKSADEHFDSNCITPGTPFMARLAVALRYYIYDRLNSHPGWKNLIVYLSDANAPGEGEHKIMDFIRRQRSSPTHDANTRHCLCGADADLIMLGLATHEPHFTIIREEFKPNQPKPCELCGEFGHEMEDCVGTAKEEEEAFNTASNSGAEPEFIFIRLNVLREYLTKDLELPGITFEWDLERVIDDWVFMCFFVGNDFLPHLPSLEIREGAIDRLIELYKSAVQSTGGWLTDSGEVHMERVQCIMVELGKMEDEIFKKRRGSELGFRERKRRQSNHSDSGRPQHHSQSPRWQPTAPESGLLRPVALQNQFGIAHPQGRSDYHASVTVDEVRQARRNHPPNTGSVNWVEQNLHNLEAATAMKAMLRPSRRSSEKSFHGALVDDDTNNSDTGPSPSKKRCSLTASDKRGRLGGVGADAVMKKLPKDADYTEEEVSDANDEVRLWEDGWRSRYYQSKFGVDPDDAPEFCIQVGREYARGLCWVLAYYYQGCASWDWYFPYHYAPFASDFVGIENLEPGFDLVETKPFRPLEQLMGVFPADSRSHVPPAWQDLMTDPDSPIIDFYPTDFKIDLNGKRYLWMGVALLPFVDEVRLLKVLDERRCKLTSEELERNVRGPDRLFCSTENPLCALLDSLYKRSNKSPERNSTTIQTETSRPSVIDPRLTHGIAGQIWPDHQFGHLPGSNVPSGVPSLLPALKSCQAISVCFADPAYPKGFHFPARLLDSVKMPPPTHLQPPQQRGRGRGRGRGSFNTSDRASNDIPSGRFNSSSAMQYCARDNSYDRDQSRQPSAMNRMVQHSLPPRFTTQPHSYGDPRYDRYSNNPSVQHAPRDVSHFRPNNYEHGSWNGPPRRFHHPDQQYDRPRHQEQHHLSYYHTQRGYSNTENFRRPHRY